MVYIIPSVDWEPNHGPYRRPGNAEDYTGIELATSVLQGILDMHRVPMTWFLETSWNPKRNTTTLFPELVRGIGGRQRDDIGLHIHWSKEGTWGMSYETGDPVWLRERLAHGVEEIRNLTRRPRFFRSGSFLRVTGLAGLLVAAGFAADSSTRFGVANTYKRGSPRTMRGVDGFFDKVRRAKRALSSEWSWYRTGRESVEEQGESSLVEFPVSFNVFDLMIPWKANLFSILHARFAAMDRPMFLTLFFHIDDFIDPCSSARAGDICREKEAFFRRFLEKWSSVGNTAFVCMGEALTIALRP